MMQGTVRFPGMPALRGLCSLIKAGKALLTYDSQQVSLVLSLTEAAFREQPLGKVSALCASTPDSHLVTLQHDAQKLRYTCNSLSMMCRSRDSDSATVAAAVARPAGLAAAPAQR